MEFPEILRLCVQRFRGIKSLDWRPAQRVNVILGGGNAGKTTLQDAIGLLLHPTNGYVVVDADYWLRKVEDEFFIEAVMALPLKSGIHGQSVFAWPWEWNGEDAVLPSIEGYVGEHRPVYKLRVHGTADLELIHEIIQPDGTSIPLSAAMRRNIGLVRLAGDDRSDRDLRLIQGGGLDRLLADKGLRARLGRKVGSGNVEEDLNEEAQQRLQNLDVAFTKRALPSHLGLGFVGTSGISINALVGLMAEKDSVPLPLTNWGAGTRRLAALAISETLQEGAPITLVDELERGLEPYRQRRLMSALCERPSQVLVTTHSAAVISAATGAAFWYIDVEGRIGSLPSEKIDTQIRKDAEAFLARLTIVVEGATELGFVQTLLTHCIGETWKDEGIHVTDASSNEHVLKLLEALSQGGLQFAGFADSEPANPQPGRWRRLKDKMGDLLLQWEVGNLEQNILPYFAPADLERLIAIPPPDDWRSSQRRKSLALRLGLEDSRIETIVEAAGGRVMDVLIEAATGFVPADMKGNKDKEGACKGHSRQWFKSIEGGAELANKMFELNAWPRAKPRLLPFLTAISEKSGMPLTSLAKS